MARVCFLLGAGLLWDLLRLSSSVRQTVLRAGFPSFAEFVQLYGRSYRLGSAEWEQRRGLYEQKVSDASRHNSWPGRRWTAGVNEFWDWTAAEQLALRGWRRGALPEGGIPERSGTGRTNFLEQAALPREKNWTRLLAARAVRNQGSCGSCWAIASTTMLQAHTEIHTREARTFSPQQLVSCVPNPQHCGGGGGCTGATVELAMDWVMRHGCAEEYQVPYVSSDTRCPAPVQQGGSAVLADSGDKGIAAAFGMHGWERLPENEYLPLMHAVVERGPVAVSVAARTWTIYAGGIFDGCAKDAILDHAVVLMGFGVDPLNGDPYWLVQNSWGTGWGEGGRIRLLRHTSNTAWCGVDDQPELGTGCDGGPEKVTVCGMCGILYDNVVPHFSA
eukprot:CAMPEP_0179023558 /NCGR_PEP_ID=MMETSP0796-20121207/6993_1 /TAXON_ID=73915 /ORGANISM="Pyrodinium bahamense, Strain pbaha01" /LENGTH=388 /DNA_ID=CAMNT_0020719475 /DNA_START=69 /DNA_END=1235 /DNA_ORIENTATION=+